MEIRARQRSRRNGGMARSVGVGSRPSRVRIGAFPADRADGGSPRIGTWCPIRRPPPTSTPSARTANPPSWRSDNRAPDPLAGSAGTPWRSCSAPTRNRPSSAAISPASQSAATLYDVGFNHFWHARAERPWRRSCLLPGPFLARHLCARLPRRPADRRPA